MDAKRNDGSVRLVFTGDIRVESFLAFARHRAARLDLALVVEAAAPDRVAVTVGGQPALLDAFEMACSLGPRDCLLRDVHRDAGPGARDEGQYQPGAIAAPSVAP